MLPPFLLTLPTRKYELNKLNNMEKVGEFNLLPKKEHTALVSKIGYKLLNENRIPYKITFVRKIPLESYLIS